MPNPEQSSSNNHPSSEYLDDFEGRSVEVIHLRGEVTTILECLEVDKDLREISSTSKLVQTNQ